MQSRHNIYTFDTGSAILKVDSDFDSGNLEQATLSDHRLILTPSLDPMNSQYSTKQSSKTFFHFRIATDATITLAITIRNMKILEYFANVGSITFRKSNSSSNIEYALVADRRRV